MDYIKINLPGRKKRHILALGAQSKASFCFVKNGYAYLLNSGGDLSDLENFRLFERQINQSKAYLGLKPEIIGCDLHPEYMSTKYANDLKKSKGPQRIKVKAIQHHEAHVASCMADNNIKGNAIGVAFDGIGLGLDGNIWGGEFFTGSIKGFKRRAHLQYIPIPGSEASIREPWRMAVSYLYSIYGRRIKDLKLDFLKTMNRDAKDLIIQIIDKRINSPLTSSAGRLFDAVSSILDICSVARYEGQAAIELEKIIEHKASVFDNQNKYRFHYNDKNGVVVIDWTDVIKGVVNDLRLKKKSSEISVKFHNSICHMIKDVCNLIRKKDKVFKVCLTGGVFQNNYLNSHLKPLLEKENFAVYFHKRIPAHDGNVALGQAAIAFARG
ncbi:hypothetical protein ACFL0P_06875 [Candidatus Omnitrophota bacterium]